jgi:hypothetical protein
MCKHPSVAVGIVIIIYYYVIIIVVVFTATVMFINNNTLILHDAGDNKVFFVALDHLLEPKVVIS